MAAAGTDRHAEVFKLVKLHHLALEINKLDSIVFKVNHLSILLDWKPFGSPNCLTCREACSVESLSLAALIGKKLLAKGVVLALKHLSARLCHS
jgi:sulfate adenylyltransferase subunit 1 (EFTu-like GTPase family)